MKPTTRMLTAVLLTSMMMLSGCLGTDTGEDTEDWGGIIPTAQGSTTTVVNGNYLPMLSMGLQIGPLWENENTTTTSSNGSTTKQHRLQRNPSLA